MRLAGKTAIVTGAGSGIGRAIAERLAREGAAVTVSGQRLARVEETARAIEASGGRAFAVACDVAKEDQVQRMVEQTVARFGRLDVLVNNAAKNRPDAPLAETVADLTEEWWHATASARPPAASIARAVSSTRARRCPDTVTAAPSRARRSAIARPMPEPAPVTIAAFPASLMPRAATARRRGGTAP